MLIAKKFADMAAASAALQAANTGASEKLAADLTIKYSAIDAAVEKEVDDTAAALAEQQIIVVKADEAYKAV